VNRYGPPAPQRDPEPDGAPDEDYARAYADGYGEGLREAFRELLSHASRGHTPQELRMLVESRLARVKEDIEFKRRSMLAPPRRPDWGSLLRSPAPAPTVLGSLATTPVPRAGGTYLWWEARPQRSVDFVAANLGRFPRLLWISIHPPPGRPDLPPEKLTALRVGPRLSAPTAGEGTLGPEQIAGQVQDAVAEPGGALVYLEAVEFLSTEYQTEGMHRLVNFIASKVVGTTSVFVASVDPDALAPTDRSRLGHSFGTVS
jgi:hypothetical protein